MKKRIFLVSTLVVMAMSAMFVACSKNDKNDATASSNGCNCTINDGSGNETDFYSKGDMAQMGATTCDELTGVLRGMYMSHDISASISCR